MSKAEVWRRIPGFSNYEVSSLGQIRSYRRSYIPKLIKPYKQRYLKVVLINDDGFLKAVRIQHMVALAFIGPVPPDHCLHHIDGDKLNNILSNLKYILTSVHQLMHSLENHSNAKLKNIDIPCIRQLIAKGMPLNQIGKMYSVNHATIKDIRDKKTWFYI